MKSFGPFFYQWWGGLFTSGFAFAVGVGRSYWCVEVRRDPRFKS